MSYWKPNTTSNKNIDNVMLLGMAGQIAKKHKNKGEALAQSSINSQNALLPFQGSKVITSVLSTMNERSRVEVTLINS